MGVSCCVHLPAPAPDVLPVWIGLCVHLLPCDLRCSALADTARPAFLHTRRAVNPAQRATCARTLLCGCLRTAAPCMAPPSTHFRCHIHKTGTHTHCMHAPTAQASRVQPVPFLLQHPALPWPDTPPVGARVGHWRPAQEDGGARRRRRPRRRRRRHAPAAGALTRSMGACSTRGAKRGFSGAAATASSAKLRQATWILRPSHLDAPTDYHAQLPHIDPACR